jgi:hypothetical protein
LFDLPFQISQYKPSALTKVEHASLDLHDANLKRPGSRQHYG